MATQPMAGVAKAQRKYEETTAHAHHALLGRARSDG